MNRMFGLFTGLLIAAGALASARADFTYTSTFTSEGNPYILTTSNVNGGGILSLVSNSTSVTNVTGNSSTVTPALVYYTGLPGTANFNGSPGWVDTVTFTSGSDSVTWNIAGNFSGTYAEKNMSLSNTFSSPTSFTKTFADGTIFSLTGVTMSSPVPPTTGTSDTAGQAGLLQGTFSIIQGNGTSGGNGGTSGGNGGTSGGNGGTSGGNGGTSGGNGGTVQTPEPSTLLLAGMGLSAMVAVAWRKRRKPAVALALA